MKKTVVAFVLGALLSTCVFAYASQPIKLIVDGQEVSFPEAPPQIVNDRVMVPARPLAEALGATVVWDSASNSVIITGKTESVQELVKEGYENMQPINKKDDLDVFLYHGVEYVQLKQVDDKYTEKNTFQSLLKIDLDTTTKILGLTDKSTNQPLLTNIPYIVINEIAYIKYDYYANQIKPLLE